MTCKTIHSVFNLNWDFACQSTFYIRIQILSGGKTRYIRRVRRTKNSCTLTAPAGACEGRREGQLGAPLGPHICCLLSLHLTATLLSSCYTSWPLTAGFSPFLSMQIFFVTPLHLNPPPTHTHRHSLFFWMLLVHLSYTQEGAFLFPANKWSTNGAAPLISITASETYCFPRTDPYFLLFPTFHLIKLGLVRKN